VVRKTFLALREDLALLPLEETFLDLGHLLTWCLMLTLFISLHDEFRWEVSSSLIYPLENLSLLLCELALQAALDPHFIILSPENFTAIGIRYTGSSGDHAPNLVDHPIVLLFRWADGG
jgi:hypothetical protein